MHPLARLGLLVLPLCLASCEHPPVSSGAAEPATSSSAPSVSASAAGAGPAAPAGPIADDTPDATPAGVTFVVPAGFRVQKEGARAVLTGPEADLRVVITDAKEASADDAVAAAWKAYQPDFKRPLKVTQPRPGRRGWEEMRAYDYETSANEKLIVAASARRRGASWTVVLIESGKASIEKRSAQVTKIGDSLRPAGYTRESFAGKAPKSLDATRIKQITDMVEAAREKSGIPGVALALVQDGKIVYEGGLGVKEMGKPDKVDAHTRFLIASNTKAMATLLLAKLVDEGKLGWDTPVTTVYPSFKLGDASTTQKVLVKHLICACTGLPRQDLEWLFEYKDRTPEGSMGLLATMQPTTKFGETFQYSNMMAAAAGFVGGRIVYPGKELGQAFDEAMAAKVFGPLGMTETTFDFARARKGNHAGGHELDIDGNAAPALTEVNRAVIPVRPAGGAWSTAHDVAQYVMMELAKGELPDKKRFIAEEALLARRKPQVAMGEFSSYGMGLMVDNEWGTPMVHHGGDMIGYHSDMFWLPEANVGGVILTNGPGFLIRRAFIRKTAEVLFDGSPEAADDAAANVQQMKARLAAERKRLTVPPDASVIAKLAKRYTSKELGGIAVARDGATVTFDFGEWKSAMATRKNDDGTSSVVTIAPGLAGIELVLADREGRKALVLRDMQHEYVFLEAQ